MGVEKPVRSRKLPPFEISRSRFQRYCAWKFITYRPRRPLNQPRPAAYTKLLSPRVQWGPRPPWSSGSFDRPPLDPTARYFCIPSTSPSLSTVLVDTPTWCVGARHLTSWRAGYCEVGRHCMTNTRHGRSLNSAGTRTPIVSALVTRYMYSWRCRRQCRQFRRLQSFGCCSGSDMARTIYCLRIIL